MFIAGGMTIFSYEWLEKYFDQKEKLHLAAIEEFEYFGIKHDQLDEPSLDFVFDESGIESQLEVPNEHVLNAAAADETEIQIQVPELVESKSDVISPKPNVLTDRDPNNVHSEDIHLAVDNIHDIEDDEKSHLELPKKDLPWHEIRAKVEEQRGELTFEKEQAPLPPDEQPFWEVDKQAGKSPERLAEPVLDDSNEVSWEEPENIMNLHELGPAPLYKPEAIDRFVHLDFKGSPLKLSYLEELFPKLVQWGATGLLIEYEDSFPFEGQFEKVKGSFSFSVDDINKINQMASANNLTVIPYVSLFDDLDFVLKNPDFKKYREMPHYSEMISPLHEGSVQLAVSILRQVLQKHPTSKYVHIGCRKPHMLGWSLISKQWMHKHEKTANELYLDYVTQLAIAVRSEFHVNVIIWGNLIVSLPFHVVTESGIHKNVHLMLESYKAKNLEFDDDSLKDLGKLFPSVWLAGSFKGTVDSTKSIPSMMSHARNINELLGLSRVLVRSRINFKGTMLMGYSRKHHSSSLAELFPVAIPTLICCLQALKDGELSTITEYKAAKLIGFRSAEIPEVSWPRPLPVVAGEFPGSEIWKEVQEMENLIYNVKRVLDSKTVKLYLTEYHTKETIVDIMPVKEFSTIVRVQQIKLEKERKTVEDLLQEVFYYETIGEFVDEHIDIYVKKLRSLNNKILEILGS